MTAGPELRRASEECLRLLDLDGLTVATAESCTGGMIAAALTDHPGASRVVNRGFIVYADDAKAQLLGVSPAAVAATGIAGPAGATPEKPVGLVHIAAGRRGHRPRHERLLLAGDRQRVREQAAVRALGLLMQVAAQP